MQKNRPDLQLLASFDALMRERQVSRAAEKMGLSQSSMSEALTRLRTFFGDPLLVRGHDGMVPTPRALEIAGRVRALLDQSEQLLDSGHGFDPENEKRAFGIIASDFTQFLLMPRLLAELAARAPRISIEVPPVHVRQIEPVLESGQADLAIGLVLEPAATLRRRVLFRERSLCIARLRHPALHRELTPAAFAALPHIHVAPSGLRYFSAPLDHALERENLTRHLVFTSPHFLLAAHVVASTDAVLYLPARVARRLAEILPLAMFEPPLEIPDYEIAMLWHERTHASAAHVWLRQLAIEVLPRGAASAANAV